jgi:hypothetical protein
LHDAPGAAISYKYDAETTEFARPRQLGRNAPGVQNGRVLIGELASDPVWRETVFIDDMKEVAHAGGIRSERCQLPVTNV